MRGSTITRRLPATAALLAVTPLSAPALGGTERLIDFENLQHGLIVADDTDKGYIPGVSISVDNFNSSNDFAVIFDTSLTGTADRDLEGPSWSGGGNLAFNTVLGNALIIQETSGSAERNDGTFVDRPNDEGSRPGGELTFSFDQRVTSFGFDLIDVEGPEEFGRDSGFFATFIEDDNQVRVGFGAFVDPDSDFYQPGVAFGDNSANRIAPITAEELGLNGFDEVVINLGGSSAVDNIRFTAVPSPTAAGAGLVALIGLTARRRRRTADDPAA
ncbi:MAG: hypothetical protein AAGI68_02725 [Planctomycetota bacterium]